MPTLYVTEPGASVRWNADQFVVTVERDDEAEPGRRRTKKRETLIAVEPHRLELIVLVGRTHLTGDAAHAALDRGISVAYTDFSGRLRGRIVPDSPRSGDLRLLQYRAHSQADERLVLARKVVAAKVRGGIEVLLALQSNDAGNEILASSIRDLRSQAERITECPAIDILRGLEGNAARTYFAALRTGFKSGIQFDGRSSRPPADPANALMSFGYVLVTNVLAGMLEARGLDPSIGFYHEVRPGRPSLALDLLEEFRHPLVDRFVLRMGNLRILKPEDFEPDRERGGVRMTRAALRTFFDEWEKHLQRAYREGADGEKMTARELFDRQVERLVADLRGRGPYRPSYHGAPDDDG